MARIVQRVNDTKSMPAPRPPQCAACKERPDTTFFRNANGNLICAECKRKGA